MKKIDFLATDGLKLNGLLYESNQKTDKVILSVHGMSSNFSFSPLISFCIYLTNSLPLLLKQK